MLWRAIVVLSVLVSSVVLAASPPPQRRLGTPPLFKAQAVLAMADGTAVEINNFSLYGEWERFSGVLYTPCHVSDAEPGVFLWKEGSVLKGMRARDIQEIEILQPSGEWMNSRLQFADGREVQGRLPTNPHATWVKGETFHLVAQRKLLGTVGEFRIPLKEVRRVQRGAAPTVFRVTDAAGTTVEVTDPGIGREYTCPAGERDSFNLENGKLPVLVDKTRLDIPLREVAVLLFPESAKGLSVTIRTKKGDEAAGELLGVECVYGTTASGQIWFVDLKAQDRFVIRSIEFR